MRVDTPDGRGGVADEKRALRARMRDLRRALASARPDAGVALARACGDHPALTEAGVVAGYHAIGTEIDVAPLLRLLAARDVKIALPAVRGDVMRFHLSAVDGPFTADDCNIPAPPAEAASTDPDVVIAPLLAFDDQGGRLGYGGGWYDRTLKALQMRKPGLIVYGAAYSGQKVDYTPRQSHDILMDGVFLELGAVQAAS